VFVVSGQTSRDPDNALRFGYSSPAREPADCTWKHCPALRFRLLGRVQVLLDGTLIVTHSDFPCNVNGFRSRAGARARRRIWAFGWIGETPGQGRCYAPYVAASIDGGQMFRRATRVADAVRALTRRWGATGRLVAQRYRGGSRAQRTTRIEPIIHTA
jgi:hypothetical protein